MLAINIDDVISVLNTIRPYLIALCVALVLAIVVTVACMKLNRPLKKLVRKESWIAFLLVAVVIINMICFGPMSSLISLATGDGSITDATSEEAKKLCTEIAEEGIVLLKNDGALLPIASGTKLNVFGWSSTNPVYGGTGSGSLSDAYPTVSLLDGLRNAGFEVNEDLVNFYTQYRATRPTIGMFGQDWTIPEPTIDEYNAAGIFESAKEFSDTAVIVIARSGGEGADLPTSLDPAFPDTYSDEGSMFGASGVRYSENKDDLDASKHYLELTTRERAMVERVTSDYSNVIVVINAANAMELGFVNEFSSIKSVLLCPGTGQTGFEALGEIIAGTVNPSGKTADTFVADLTQTPTWNNFGNFVYDNMDEYAADSFGMPVLPTFVDYTDNIYVGYRFWETAAEEGLIDYDANVLYPFGYGLSYTSFTQTLNGVSESNGVITVDVTVTNTGSVAGKDVVEVYYNPPYTNGGIEKASVNLAGFAKTDLLEAGASQNVTVTFNVEDMASYDAAGAKAYVLEAGDYLISIRSDSHTIIDEQPYTVATTVTGRESDAVAATNQFDAAYGEDVIYLSRADGFANYEEATAAPTNFSLSANLKSTFFNNSNYDPANYNNSADVMPTTGANNGMTLADLRGLSYDDEKWEALLDQMTISDMNEVIAIGGYQTAAASSVGKVQTIDCDGPASINNNFTQKGSIGFPAAVMIASTWNIDLAKAFGASIGKMADEMAVSGWYAPAMNTHRSAFAGRNFEYYSEDGLLSGKMAANAVIGAEQYGVYAYVKHFALNDQETNRTNMLCTWATEQSIREIYLKPFEIAIKEGGADAVMSAFNYIGTVPAQAMPELLNTVLRDEWGFRGFVLTDYYGVYGYQDADRMIRGGNDCMLVAYDAGTNYVTDTTSATSVIAMRQAVKNIMYTTVNSRAYDPANLSGGLQSWQIAAIVIDIILVALSIFLAFRSFQRYKKDTSAGNAS